MSVVHPPHKTHICLFLQIHMDSEISDPLHTPKSVSFAHLVKHKQKLVNDMYSMGIKGFSGRGK